MDGSLILKKSYKESILIYETADNIWIRKTIVRHGMIIHAKLLVYHELILFNFFLCSLFFPKCSNSELTVIDIHESILGSIVILNNVINFDVLLWTTSDYLMESLLLTMEVIHDYIGCTFILFCHQKNSG